MALTTEVDRSSLFAGELRYDIGSRRILDRVSLDVQPGLSVAITGPSGSGKTTLLLCLAGLLPVASGQIWFGQVELTVLKARDRTAFRLANIGIVYQFGELIPELSPLENAALPALLAGRRRQDAENRAMELLGDLGVADVAKGQTATLSGGERQRVAVARALINNPKLLLADEPTGSLDTSATDVVAELLFSLPRQHGCAMIIVTHNPEVARLADEQWRLESGKMTEVVA